MDNFQSAAAVVIVIATAFIMIYSALRKKGSPCAGGCCDAKTTKIPPLKDTRPS